ncbi:MAG TPA: glucan biosynthesis protein D, partial [Nevskiaceae bacterium]|nr:glucan biosynthesis protein D [Nevskiaceae bacterium]
MNRRDLLRAAASLTAAGLPFPFAALAAADPGATRLRKLGQPQPFDYATLKGKAAALASQPYVPREIKLPPEVAALDYDDYQSLKFRKDHMLWGNDPSRRFEVAFFHLGIYFKKPVRMYEVIGNQAQEIAYDPGMFDYGKTPLAGSHLRNDLGFAGFRVIFHTDETRDVAAFLGASYFRAVGSDWQYGLSARGLAVDTGLGRDEEFPDFVGFWLVRPDQDSSRMTVYALLDSPSVAGAYRFDLIPGATALMDVDAALYPRKPIERLGIAPLTSMYQHGENDRRMAHDWRPEIHDSDGLAMWTGTGEWVWRPLNNPAHLRYNAHQDENPRGFGLLQRDREFDHYQDDGVYYERRPSLWVETKGNWGKGAITLVELPTRDETLDNIVAFWNPAAPVEPGKEMLFSYRLHWGRQMPASTQLAYVVATRTGLGGIVGQKRTKYSYRFTVDFVGGDLSMIGAKTKVEPVITVSR